MPRYDFTSLSSQDFEDLTRDLLQAEWNVTIEAFKTGRDRGIDLRYATGDSGRTIIQCKHYAKSGSSKLIRDLRDRERPKIEQLHPNRYVVVTSAELTPDNKDAICRVLQPFVLNSRDHNCPAITRTESTVWRNRVNRFGSRVAEIGRAHV